MVVPQETVDKMANLPSDKLSVIVQLVDQMSMDSLDMLRSLREDGLKNPMDDEEIDDFVDSVRKEIHVSGN